MYKHGPRPVGTRTPHAPLGPELSLAMAMAGRHNMVWYGMVWWEMVRYGMWRHNSTYRQALGAGARGRVAHGQPGLVGGRELLQCVHLYPGWMKEWQAGAG
jgi:hypothetical protein